MSSRSRSSEVGRRSSSKNDEDPKPYNPEESIPDKPENENARNFLKSAPSKGLWLPMGMEVKVMQCWRCKAYGHRTGDRECPMSASGNLVLDAERQAREDPMARYVATGMEKSVVKSPKEISKVGGSVSGDGDKYARRKELEDLMSEIRREAKEKKRERKEKKKKSKRKKKKDKKHSSKKKKQDSSRKKSTRKRMRSNSDDASHTSDDSAPSSSCSSSCDEYEENRRSSRSRTHRKDSPQRHKRSRAH